MTRGGIRPGAGRKPSRDESATHTIQVRVTEAEKSTLVAAAALSDLSLSEWLRRVAINEAVRREDDILQRLNLALRRAATLDELEGPSAGKPKRRRRQKRSV